MKLIERIERAVAGLKQEFRYLWHDMKWAIRTDLRNLYQWARNHDFFPIGQIVLCAIMAVVVISAVAYQLAPARLLIGLAS